MRDPENHPTWQEAVMSHELTIPAVGESIATATIGQWHKADGDYVRSGEVVLTIETDKISTELEADRDGVLRQVASEGDELEIGAVVATIEEGEAPAESDAEEPSARGTQEDESPGEGGTQSPAPQGGEAKATPVARRMADDRGVDLGSVTGTGAGGRVTKADVAAASATQSSEGPSTPPLSVVRPAGETAPEAAGGERTTRRKMTPLRRKIAEHLVNAQQSAAILTTFNECDMSRVMALRKEVQEDFVGRHGIKLGFMSFFIKAVVDALQAVPQVNARIEGDEIVENHFCDIGVAVGTERGLIVPVVCDCEGKSFAEIEQTIAGYAKAAREGTIQFDDLQGGVFTITNGGIYGSLLSTPILNPPQSGILGMHSIQERPVAVAGEVVIRPMMYLALSYDHRIVDGKEAVTFLVRVKDCIENPDRMLVGA